MCCHVHVASGQLTKCQIRDMRTLYDQSYSKRCQQTKKTTIFTQLKAKIITHCCDLCLALLSSSDFTFAILFFYIITENSIR